MKTTIFVGDCLDTLKSMPAQSVHCCVTSPPYFGLRDYGHAGQIGNEATPDEFVSRLAAVFAEVHRVLRDDGTLWLNLGDSYAAQRGGTEMPAETLAGGSGGKQVNGKGLRGRGKDSQANGVDSDSGGKNKARLAHRNASAIGLKHKDLIGIPWRVAFALQSFGWYLRQDIIWHKPNPMPESVTDRCTKAHEYIFLLSKSEKYFYSADGVKEQQACSRKRGPAAHRDAVSTNGNTGLALREPDGYRNRRSVWTVTTKPFTGAHFATFPEELIKPCILAGCPEGGTVLDPFGGAGTTALVANSNSRDAILCELNPEYARLAESRINSVLPMYSDVRVIGGVA